MIFIVKVADGSDEEQRESESGAPVESVHPCRAPVFEVIEAKEGLQ